MILAGFRSFFGLGLEDGHVSTVCLLPYLVSVPAGLQLLSRLPVQPTQKAVPFGRVNLALPDAAGSNCIDAPERGVQVPGT